MKLFVVLLALRLTAADTLNRRYLPPPGAKLSGGRSDDLQTPLEYPTETYGTSEYGSVYRTVYAADDTDNVKIAQPDENDLSMVTNGHYHKSISDFRSGFDPGHMPIIAVPENIGQNYQPHLFGMYGGNPMSIKYFDNNIEVAGSDDLITSDKNIKNPQEEQNLPTTLRPNTGTATKGTTFSQNLSFKKFERPQANADRRATILNYKNVQNTDGYFYNFETSNGIHKDESASTLEGVKAKGSYSYRGDDGKVYTVTYTADENGFQPSGDHLPKIPQAIQNVIQQAKRDKDAAKIMDDGSYDETKYGHMKYQGPVYRYMQKNAENHKRKNVSGGKKILGPSKIIKYNTNKIMRNRTENLQTGQNKNRKPFEMRRTQLFDKNRNEEDAVYIQSPNTKESQDIFLSDFSQKVNNNEDLSNGMILHNIQRNSSMLNPIMEKNFKTPAIPDGYFYVPPENVFVEGKYQDIVFTDQQNEKNIFSDKDLRKITQYITSTEKPFYQQTYDSNFYATKSAKGDQSVDYTRTTIIAPSDTKTTVQYYGNTLITKPYDTEFTKEIVKEEETVIPENRVQTDFSSSQSDLDTANYQTTTPMSSEARYTIQSYENTNQYETTSSESALTSSNFDVDYSEEGYFKTTPEKTATFEEFPLSTYDSSSIYTTEGIISTESTSNVNVDEIGSTRQESFGYNTDSLTDSFTNGMESDTKSKESTPYDDYGDTFRTNKPDNKSITQFYNEFGTDINKTPDDLHYGRDTIIGEDFSGPKQPQRYDPKQGYYY